MNTTSIKIKQTLYRIVSLLFESDNDDAIREALSVLAEYFDVDWVYVAEIDQPRRLIHYLYEVNSQWVKPTKDTGAVMTFDNSSWIVEQVLNGKDVLLSDVEDIPSSCQRTRELFRQRGLLSTLIVPMTFQDKIWGFLGLESTRGVKHWPKEELEDLHFTSMMFSIIIERKSKQDAVAEEKRRNEEELQRVRDADRLKSAFLANMSHEIRTPLNAIVGFSNIISEVTDSSTMQYYQQIITKNNDLLLQIISDVLDFAKMESDSLTYRYSHVNLKELCQDISFRYTARSTQQVRFIYAPNQHEDVILYTDPQRLTQVLTNIISNAFKFTIKGDIVLSYHLLHQKVRISVTDTGIGIEQKDIPTIFDRFIKLDEFSQGTGLGLTISKTVTEALGGKIGVDSKPGKGSVFWITLPLPKE
ncbi:GAF domain-containing sensor histidine kinase [Parabacteroides sp. OttesenSCG-928-N08]|nr:GAF domain-containing sensor histidine kinase [Parabacteroides sp. OttesenSCG-928-N08]